jgi:hypothetical protein
MGAAGTRTVVGDLTSRGHDIAELERYSTSNKLWTTKIKRLRLPDLFCLRCDLRVEARAKSHLEIKLSHSATASREWDAGLRDIDLLAFTRCDTDGLEIRSMGDPEYFAVDALRRSVGLARLGPPKAASAGAERDLTWPSIVPTQSGTVISADDSGVRVELEGGRRQTYRNRWAGWSVYIPVGRRFRGGQQFLAGPVPKSMSPGCPGQIWDPRVDLSTPNHVDRYAAVKACGLLRIGDARGPLAEIVSEESDDARIRLEAIGALARLEDGEPTRRLEALARASGQAQGLSLEAVFILSELGSDEAAAVLVELARDTALGEDVRSAAVWGLGVSGARRADLLLEFAGDPNDVIALHAIAGFPTNLSYEQIELLKAAMSGSDREAASAAEILTRQGVAGVSALLDVLQEGGLGWDRALVALGRIPRSVVEPAAGGRLDAAAKALLEPLWRDGDANWTQTRAIGYELALLDQQTPPR